MRSSKKKLLYQTPSISIQVAVVLVLLKNDITNLCYLTQSK